MLVGDADTQAGRGLDHRIAPPHFIKEDIERPAHPTAELRIEQVTHAREREPAPVHKHEVLDRPGVGESADQPEILPDHLDAARVGLVVQERLQRTLCGDGQRQVLMTHLAATPEIVELELLIEAQLTPRLKAPRALLGFRHHLDERLLRETPVHELNARIALRHLPKALRPKAAGEIGGRVVRHVGSPRGGDTRVSHGREFMDDQASKPGQRVGVPTIT